MTVNPGIWVRQALATAPKSHGKYANVALEKWSFQEMMDVWCEVTGKKGEFVPCSTQQWTNMWGPMGTEVSFPGLSMVSILVRVVANFGVARAAAQVRGAG